MSKLFKIFVSSTFSDLQEQRQNIFETIIRKKCFPVGMEYFPPLTRKSLNYIYQLINECDFFLLLLGGRYGKSLDEHGTSFTQLEYQHAREKNIPVIPLIMEDWRRAPMTDEDSRKAIKLEQFIETVKEDFDGWKPWTDSKLMLLVSEALEQAIKDNPKAIGWIRADSVTLLSNHEDYYRESNDENSSMSDEEKAIAMVKKYLADPAAQIKLHELIASETNNVVNEIQRVEFSACDTLDGELNGVQLYSDEERISMYEKICSKLLKLLCVISRWGDERQADLITDTLQRISLAKPENYNPRRVILVNIQLYPALLLFYAVGITRLAAKKYDLFAKSASFTYVDYEGKEMPFIVFMKPDKVLRSVALPRSAPYLISYIFDTLREPLRELISDDKMYRNYTERFEYYKWIAVFFEAENREFESAAKSGFPWYFFASIHYEKKSQRLEPLSRTIMNEIERNGANWEAFKYGFCNSDKTKITEIVNSMISTEEKTIEDNPTKFFF